MTLTLILLLVLLTGCSTAPVDRSRDAQRLHNIMQETRSDLGMGHETKRLVRKYSNIKDNDTRHRKLGQSVQRLYYQQKYK